MMFAAERVSQCGSDVAVELGACEREPNSAIFPVEMLCCRHVHVNACKFRQ
jgi:hypothetical protein